MDGAMTTFALPIALGIVMFGLGLSLTTADFLNVGRRPKAVGVALACQLLLLPLLCFGIVLAFGLPPILAVGMMLLAASPGGATANLYSHLFRGDVALNISLTAINSVIAAVTLPLVVNLSIAFFQPADLQLGLQFRKVVEVFMIVLVPVGLGMAVRAMKPGFAAAMERPVKIASVLILALVIGGSIAANRELLAQDLLIVAGAATAFCVLSLFTGYQVPRLAGVQPRQAVACAFEIGLHNATLAIVVAQSVLMRPDMSLPAAVYGILMFPLALAFGLFIRRRVPAT